MCDFHALNLVNRDMSWEWEIDLSDFKVSVTVAGCFALSQRMWLVRCTLSIFMTAHRRYAFLL